jgi:hypothetical protein
MTEYVKAARALLDQQIEGRRDWVTWAGDCLMPQMWALVRQDEEREETARRQRDEEEKRRVLEAKAAAESKRQEEEDRTAVTRAAERRLEEERTAVTRAAERRLEEERKTQAMEAERLRDFERRKKDLEDDFFDERISQQQYEEELARLTRECQGGTGVAGTTGQDEAAPLAADAAPPKKQIPLFELSSSNDETDSKRERREKPQKLPSITIPPLKRGREEDTGLRSVSGKVRYFLSLSLFLINFSTVRSVQRYQG